MRLIDLQPAYEQEDVKTIGFQCPKCGGHRINIPIEGRQAWGTNGQDFFTLTLTPSIAHTTQYADWPSDVPRECQSHFWITNGQIVNA